MNPLMNFGMPGMMAMGMPQQQQGGPGGGLAPMQNTMSGMPRSVQPILGGGALNQQGGGDMSLQQMMQDPEFQKMLMQAMQQPEQQLPGGGIGQMDISGLLMPYQPPQVDSSLLSMMGGM